MSDPLRGLIEDDHFIKEKERQREKGRRKYAWEKDTRLRNKCKLSLFREGAGDSRDRCGGECREISNTLRRRRATRRKINGGNCNANTVMRCIGDKNVLV